MRLGELLEGLEIEELRDSSKPEIEGLAYDSRAIRPGYMFVALKGTKADGHDFVKDAIKMGAAALVLESTGAKEWHDLETTIIRVGDSREALSKLAVNFYDRPFQGMNLIGITGTNGKTTASYLLESILGDAGRKPGVIGTINYRFPGHVCKGSVTTPESLDLMRILRKMKDAGVTDVIVEVSSHALDQGRTRDCPFRVCVYTNLSRDHLDYHLSMEKYFEAKSRLFMNLGELGTRDSARAVINADDPSGEELVKMINMPVVTYGLKRECVVRAEQVQATRSGLIGRLVTPAGKTDFRCPLIGHFNVYNILAASATAMCLEIDLGTVASGLAGIKGVPGRLELVMGESPFTVVVDYAHTPDALLKALEAVRAIAKRRLITVFGCGGDRDRGKRWEMGYVAGEHSDIVFITSDNPRTEDPSAIALQIEKGVRSSGLKALMYTSEDKVMGSGYVFELDRRDAIRMAVRMAGEGDLILIAGKGHEDYQIVGDEKRHFDDREVVAEAASKGH